MIKEELYVIVDGTKHFLDVTSPSGITLEYTNSLIGDLGKISCSHTYTFSLPMTVNNAKALSQIDDIRVRTDVARTRLKAGYIRNGVTLFRDANLYVESVEEEYKCVMTWGVLDGLQKLQDEGKNLKELKGLVSYYGSLDTLVLTVGINCSELGEGYNFDNTKPYSTPMYNAGVTCYDFNYEEGADRKYTENRIWAKYPYPPVTVNVRWLLSQIDTLYGTTFSSLLGQDYTGTVLPKQGITNLPNVKHPFITFGVLPLCGNSVTDGSVDIKGQQDSMGVLITGNEIYCRNKIFDRPVIGFGKYLYDSNIQMFSPLYTKNEAIYDIDSTYYNNIYTSLTEKAGYLFESIRVNHLGGVEIDGSITVFYRGSATKAEDIPDIKLKGVNYVGIIGTDVCSIEDLATIKCTSYYNANNGLLRADYNFQRAKGYKRVSFDSKYMDLYFVVDADESIIDLSGGYGIGRAYTDLHIYPSATNGRYADYLYNLPDISILDFVKSLFYIAGVFPTTTTDGQLTVKSLSSILDEIESGDCYDWSDKVIINPSELPKSISFATSSDYTRYNYILMKSDDIDKSDIEKSKEEDVYADGSFLINMEGSAVKDEKTTLYQSPYYAPYIRNRNAPFVPTGKTIKAWSFEVPSGMPDKDTLKSEDAKSAYGIVTAIHPTKHWRVRDVESEDEDAYDEHEEVDTSTSFMSMEVLPTVTEAKGYSVLQKTISDYTKIELVIRLDETELATLDMLTPVYISHFNSYFMISTIKVGDTQTTAELIQIKY